MLMSAAQTIFADDSYSKPYLVNYINTSCFAIYLIPWTVKQVMARRRNGQSAWMSFKSSGIESSTSYAPVSALEDDESPNMREHEDAIVDKLSTKETMLLSFEFCLLWFVV